MMMDDYDNGYVSNDDDGYVNDDDDDDTYESIH